MHIETVMESDLDPHVPSASTPKGASVETQSIYDIPMLKVPPKPVSLPNKEHRVRRSKNRRRVLK